MEQWRWHGLGVVDALYAGGIGGLLVYHQPVYDIGIAMSVFALLIGIVSWGETRRLVRSDSGNRYQYLLTLGLTGVLLGLWLVFASLRPTRLPLYFALLAGFFFVQAVRDAAVSSLSPIDLFLQGYVNLVAVHIVLGAAADAIDRFQAVLLVIGFVVYFVRKSFLWTGAMIAWFRGE